MAVGKKDLGIIAQLALELDLEEVDQGGGQSISPDEARLRSEAARQALESSENKATPNWMKEYFELRDAGWPWRVACYIAWAASPRRNRWPATMLDLAQEVLGLESDRVIYMWRKKNPAIDEVVAVLQAAPLYEHRADVYQALIDVATRADYKSHNDRKLFLELVGDYTPRSEVDQKLSVGAADLSGLSEEELARLASQIKDPSDVEDED